MDRLTYRQTVGQARAGDIVIHYRSPHVVAFSRVREDAKHHRVLPVVSGERYGSGWRFRTEYFDLSSPVHKEKFVGSLTRLITKHYPVDRNANIRQGYFFPFDLEGTRAVLSYVDEPLPAWLSALVSARTPAARSAISHTESSADFSAGGGFGDPDQNARVEQVAVGVVTEWYTNEGWEVISVEHQRRGFDLLCRRNGTEAHVEVKGVAGNKERFIITAAELRQAKADDLFVLALVKHALSPKPVLKQWPAAAFCRDFAFDPLQYWASKRDA